MLDHIGLAVSDLAKSVRFYQAVLRPLSIDVLVEVTAQMTGGDAHFGFGTERPFFWIGSGKHISGPTHVAFAVSSRALVDAFHSAALAAGGRDNGGPGLREYYHPNYYGAFVLDPDGNNIEAVCHGPG